MKKHLKKDVFFLKKKNFQKGNNVLRNHFQIDVFWEKKRFKIDIFEHDFFEDVFWKKSKKIVLFQTRVKKCMKKHAFKMFFVFWRCLQKRTSLL